jgi:hypothetical protein
MRFVIFGVIFLLAGAASPSGWAFDPIRLTFEEGFDLATEKRRAGDRPRLVTSAGRGASFDFTVDVGTEYQVWLDDKNAASGRRSLALKIYSKKNENVKDKIELNIVKHTDDGKLTLGSSPRFVSFNFMLDPSYEAPRQWLIHFQAWQCCALLPPPFAIRVAPKKDVRGEVEFRFVVRDDKLHQSDERSEGVEVHRMTVPRGKWQTMVLELAPSAKALGKQGRIVAWYNGNEVLNYKGDWGYEPQTKSSAAGTVQPDMALKIGIYRPRQTTVQTIYFDNVRYGPTYKSVTN